MLKNHHCEKCNDKDNAALRWFIRTGLHHSFVKIHPDGTFSPQGVRSMTRPTTSCPGCHLQHALQGTLFGAPLIVSMEKKFSTCSCVAEFWCTITSPMFAMPVLLHHNELPDIIYFCWFMCIVTALASTSYHWTNWNVLGVADCLLASAMVLVITGTMYQLIFPSYQLFINFLLYIFVTLLAVMFFVYNEHCSLIPIIVFAVACPFYVLITLWIGDLFGLGLGITALCCFLLDRKGVFALHPLWHILAGWSMYWVLRSVINSTIIN